jgi:hypothetical protein
MTNIFQQIFLQKTPTEKQNIRAQMLKLILILIPILACNTFLLPASVSGSELETPRKHNAIFSLTEVAPTLNIAPILNIKITIAQNEESEDSETTDSVDDAVNIPTDEGRHINLWPFFYYNDDKAEDSLTISVITPIIYYRKTGSEIVEFGIRPLFYYHRNFEKDTTVVDFAYPIGKYKQRGNDKNFRIFPIVRDANHTLANNKNRIAHDYFPLFWGRSEDNEPYGGLFPFYGTIKDRFGKDDLLFVMWPLYYRTVEEGFTSNNYLWPVFKTTQGDGGWGARVFPIWGHEEKTGIESSTYFLLPLVSFRERYLDTKNPLKDIMILPLYSAQWTPHSRTTTLLWPLFTYSYDTNYNYKKYALPWPFISIARSDTFSFTEFAPFFKYQSRIEGETTEMSRYFMYPIFKDQHLTSPKMTMDSYRFMLINKYNTTNYTEGGNDLWIYLFPL